MNVPETIGSCNSGVRRPDDRHIHQPHLSLRVSHCPGAAAGPTGLWRERDISHNAPHLPSHPSGRLCALVSRARGSLQTHPERITAIHRPAQGPPTTTATVPQTITASDDGKREGASPWPPSENFRKVPPFVSSKGQDDAPTPDARLPRIDSKVAPQHHLLEAAAS